MKITRIETIRLAEFPNVIWIQVHTDAGHVGLAVRLKLGLRDRPDATIKVSAV